jgi:hypothetical protein
MPTIIRSFVWTVRLDCLLYLTLNYLRVAAYRVEVACDPFHSALFGHLVTCLKER